MNILFLYWIYIKSMNISHYVCPVNFSNEKYIRVKKKKFVDIFWEKIDIWYSWIIREYFPSDEYYSYSYSHVSEFTNYSYSYSYKSWLHKSIPIPICGKNYYLLNTGKWLCSYDNIWLFNCVTMWFCYCITVWLCDCVLHNWLILWLYNCLTM